METLYPADLVNFFQNQQAVALLLLLLCVGGTAFSPSPRARAFWGVVTVTYGLVAFLVAMSMTVHAGMR